VAANDWSSQFLTESCPWANDIVTYGYNNARLRDSLSLQQPTGVWTNGFLYDTAARLSRVTSPAGAYTNTYRGAGTLVTNLALPNGSRITNAFDNVGRLTMTRLRSGGGTTLNTHSYVNNQGHQRTRQTRTDGSYADYTYDNIGQLKTAIGTGEHSTENLGYVYDAAWNLTTRTNYGTSQAFAVNVKNELTSAVGLNCTYDANGNLVSRVYDSNGPKVYYYVYDDENQLIEMRTDTYYTSAANRFKTEWVYDGFGRVRVRKEYYWYTGYEVWALSEEVRYLYDGMRVIQERNGSNTPTVSYTRGRDLSGSLEGAGGIGGLLGRSHGYSGGTWSTHNHYHADGNGNVTYLVNSSQGEAASYRYDPYGRVMGSSGTLAAANLYRFSSKEIHAKSGMYYYGFRFYEPHLQRWINRDPLGDTAGLPSILYPGLRAHGHLESWDGPNLYGFVYGNPMMGVDAHGLYTWAEWLEVIGAGLGGAGQGLVAEIDGALPGNPMAGLGLYDPCEDWVKFSRGAGGVAASTLGGAGALRGAAAWGAARTPVGNWLNHGQYLRIGPGNIPHASSGWRTWLTHGAGQNVPTLRWSNAPPAWWNHLDLRIRLPIIGIW
jgi:RHS repeat-associated protein